LACSECARDACFALKTALRAARHPGVHVTATISPLFATIAGEDTPVALNQVDFGAAVKDEVYGPVNVTTAADILALEVIG
jgi:hypothetical protein